MKGGLNRVGAEEGTRDRYRAGAPRPSPPLDRTDGGVEGPGRAGGAAGCPAIRRYPRLKWFCTRNLFRSDSRAMRSSAALALRPASSWPGDPSADTQAFTTL